MADQATIDQDVLRQRQYYADTAAQYDEMHVDDNDEHGHALAAFVGLARMKGAASVLDVGAGTGRGLLRLGRELAGVRLMGVEPVRELREAGYRHGVPADQLIDGDALALPFADNEFDFVIETGVLHHVPRPDKAVDEMLRVARLGVMISDANKFGQGSAMLRRVKAVVRTLGLWETMIRVTTRGKMSKWCEGDGLYYSYSVFDNLEQVRRKFPRIYLMNTSPLEGTDLRGDAAHIVCFAMKS